MGSWLIEEFLSADDRDMFLKNRRYEAKHGTGVEAFQAFMAVGHLMTTLNMDEYG